MGRDSTGEAAPRPALCQGIGHRSRHYRGAAWRTTTTREPAPSLKTCWLVLCALSQSHVTVARLAGEAITLLVASLAEAKHARGLGSAFAEMLEIMNAFGLDNTFGRWGTGGCTGSQNWAEVLHRCWVSQRLCGIEDRDRCFHLVSFNNRRCVRVVRFANVIRSAHRPSHSVP